MMMNEAFVRRKLIDACLWRNETRDDEGGGGENENEEEEEQVRRMMKKP